MFATEMTGPAVKPHDCALLVCAPLDRESFLADLNDPGKEFVKCFCRERPNLNEEALWKAFEPYASLAGDVSRRVRELGVGVVEKATLADFGEAARTRQVVTLAGHWRSARFRAADIADAGRVRRFLGGGAGEHETAHDLAARLNTIIETAPSDFDDFIPGSYGELAALEYKWYLGRRNLAPLLGGAVNGGAAVEFSEGFRTVPEILDVLEPELSGVLDLTVCQSVLLGEEVKRKCRRSLVLTGADLTTLDFRFALYLQTIETLVRRPAPYEDVVIDIRRRLIERYGHRKKQESRRRFGGLQPGRPGFRRTATQSAGY